MNTLFRNNLKLKSGLIFVLNASLPIAIILAFIFYIFASRRSERGDLFMETQQISINLDSYPLSDIFSTLIFLTPLVSVQIIPRLDKFSNFGVGILECCYEN